jgi:hypothetical protein
VSTSGITSSLFSQILGSSSTANQFATDLNQLGQDLQSGNLSAAQSDFVTLSQDAQDGATASSQANTESGITTSLLSELATSPGGATSFVDELNQIGTDLQSGNLSAAQGDMLSLDSTLLSAASANASSNAAPATATTAASTNTTTTSLIQAIVQAFSSGDNGAAGVGLEALASVSTSSTGASVLQSAGESLGASSSNAASPNPTTELLQGLDSTNLNTPQSALNLLA